MSENRETATAAMDQMILHLVGNIASGRAEDSDLVHTHSHVVRMCVNKIKQYQCCLRRIGPLIETNAWFGVYRVTPVILQELRGF